MVLLVAVCRDLFYLFDESIGGFTAGEHVAVGIESIWVCVRDLSERIRCRFRPCCNGSWLQVKYLRLVVWFLCEIAYLSWNIVAGMAGVGF